MCKENTCIMHCDAVSIVWKTFLCNKTIKCISEHTKLLSWQDVLRTVLLTYIASPFHVVRLAQAFRSEETCQKKDPWVTYFVLVMGPPIGGSGKNTNNTCLGPVLLHRYQVNKIHQAGEKFMDRRRRTLECTMERCWHIFRYLPDL